MAVHPILLYDKNAAALRQRSEPVLNGSRDTRQLVADLKDTLLHHANGIGLAAPQIGVYKRAIMVCLGAIPIEPDVVASGDSGGRKR